MVIDWFRRFAPDKKKRSGKRAVAGTKEDDFENVEIAQGTYSGTTKLTSGYIARCLREADGGTPQQQAELYKMILDKEAHIVPHFETRINAVLGCKWTIEDDKGNESEDLTKELKNAKVNSLMRHLLSALKFGYGSAVNMWKTGGIIEKFKEIDPENIEFDLAGNPALVTADGEVKGFAEYTDGQFILHTHKLRCGIPSQGGLLRVMVWLYFYKHYGLQHKAKFLEKFGNPFLIGKISQADFEDEEIKRQTLEALYNIGVMGSGVIPDNAELDVSNHSVSGNADAYLNWFRYIDEAFVLLILGQKATADTASGMSNGNPQENVRQDILQADCNSLMETINSQLLSFMQFFKTGKDESEFEFKIHYEPEEDLQAEATKIVTLANGGYKATHEFVSKKFKIPLQKPTEDNNNSQNPSKDGKQAFSDKPLILSEAFLAREEYVDRLTLNTVNRLFKSTEAMKEFLKPLQAEIRKAFKDIDPDDENIVEAFSEKMDEFFKRTPAIYDVMETDKFQEVLDGVLLASMVRGYIK